ncbi:lysophospholipid acyltransferase family protein [Luteolibacter algae]|uniref:Lysophospholipid acyltransferase family protein n=1 Tax=Luteolibacter algae TaxID=454151 RepID=A0ABW5D720_9BACT
MNSNPESEIPIVQPGKSFLLAVRFYATMLFMLFYWPLGVLVVMIICLCSSMLNPGEKHRTLGQLVIGKSLSSFVRILEWAGIIRIHDAGLIGKADMPGPLLIASNHPALWDAPLLIRRFLRVSCIMKAELLNNPLLRNGALFAGFLPNTPRLEMIHAALDRLKNNGRLLFFPEGTRTRNRDKGGILNRFRPGLALLASQSKAPVLPVFISSNSLYLQKGWPIWRLPPLPITVTIRVGDPMKIGEGESTRDFSRRLEELFRKELG